MSDPDPALARVHVQTPRAGRISARGSAGADRGGREQASGILRISPLLAILLAGAACSVVDTRASAIGLEPPSSSTPSSASQYFQTAPSVEEPEDEGHGIGHRILFWIPNRFFDLFDVFRLRLRVGPGVTFSVRATELADLNIGGHSTVFVGIPGPRGRPGIPWPFGLENFAGVEVSVADVTQEERRFGPNYGPLEFGIGFQLVILGIDLGVEPLDAFDFFAGIVLFDPVGDDF